MKMYQFSKIKNDDGSWRFELDGISMIVDGFTESKGQHYITNPEKAIAFFNFNGNLYGIANQIRTFNTAEEFYDQMCNQYSFFRPKTETLPSIPGRGQADSSQTSLRA